MSDQLVVLKGYLAKDDIKKRFMEILGERANGYMASIVNVMANSEALQKCDAGSIMNASLISATLDLPIDPNLGFAAIVPYKDKATFQIMYRGFIQLAIRSGQYSAMNVIEVYLDEIKDYNPITGVIEFSDFSKTTMRNEGKEKDIAGYYAWFTLNNGFQKPLFMTREQVENHAKKYSSAYKYDLSMGKKSSKWTTDFDSMGKKTVLKLLLSKWGILSVQMQKAIEFDQAVVKDNNGEFEAEYKDNEKLEHKPMSVLDGEIIEHAEGQLTIEDVNNGTK